MSITRTSVPASVMLEALGLKYREVKPVEVPAPKPQANRKKVTPKDEPDNPEVDTKASKG